MLFESVTLHRRFPYAVLGGFMFLDKGAAEDGTGKRSSTFVNGHRLLGLFTGRSDPNGRDEQYERLFLALIDATPFAVNAKFYLVGVPGVEVTLDRALDDLLRLVAERDPDFYTLVGTDGSQEPDQSASPLSLRRLQSGIVRKKKPKGTAPKKKGKGKAAIAEPMQPAEPTVLQSTPDPRAAAIERADEKDDAD